MIDILMATYNGEKFLDTQIASIVNQTYADWKLYIHDDGSNDGTKEIIQRWCCRDKRIVFLDDGLAFHSPAQNFMHLLPFSTADFVCFADQDDYWLEYKLERQLFHFDADCKTPALLVSSCFLWNTEKGTVLPKPIFNRAYALEQFLFLNGGLQGCAMLFNAALRRLVLRYQYDYVYMHDHLVSLAAFAFGKVVYLDECLFLYRQYDGNASVHIEESKVARIRQVVSNVSIPVVYAPAYRGIRAFFNAFETDFPQKEKLLFSLYLKLPFYAFWKRFFILLRSQFSLGYKKHFKLLSKLLLRPFCAEEILHE